ncbi:uncharacterized protein LOC121651903 [Melanotaenia boesemani]|uniref:uncharacterized protein LOC121651903 n=1 Tax=Melanotaenia boesemani TaxID=1250792 RepID=UPI001C03BC9D|nr:uncharacterized protein LOC121651903 [Melanotaenia boesemani]
MRGFTILFLCCFVAQVASHQITVKCNEYYDFPPTSSTPPSKPVGLTAEQVTEGGITMLKISWAISIDASIKYLTGIWIDITDMSTYVCEYIPPLAKANLTGLEQEWFHYLVPVSPEYYYISALNLPYPPPGIDPVTITTSIDVQDNQDKDPRNVTPMSRQAATGLPSSVKITPEPASSCLTMKDVTVMVIGVLAALMILSSSYIIYKMWGPNTASSLDLKNLSVNPMAAVPVLVVYPAVNSAFQGAVVALAEFLQLHCGCRVAIDMWQQEKIAELGPMRWLAEQAKMVDHVLIVSPQAKTPSSQLSHSLSHSIPELSIPAAAHDLYPLILNMVASQAKNAKELAKFWVVQLSEKKDGCLLPLELRACKTFCLMKDLNKLCRCLHAQRHSKKKLSDVIFRPGVFYSKKSTLKLREATEKSRGIKPGISMETEPLKSDVSISVNILP